MARARGNLNASLTSFDGRNISLNLFTCGSPPSKSSRPPRQDSRYLTITLNNTPIYEIKAPYSLSFLNVPLQPNELSAVLDLLDGEAGVSILSEPVGLVGFYRASLSKISAQALQLEVELVTNFNFTKIPLQLKIGDDDTLAVGEVLKVGKLVDGFLYRGMLSLVGLIRLGCPQAVRLVAFDWEADTSFKLDASILGVVGYVDIVGSSAVAGWVGSYGDPEPHRVSLRVDDRFIATMVADHTRSDVVEFGISSAKCGFHFDPEVVGSLEVGSKVAVTIGDDESIHLINSPYIIVD